MKPFRVFITQSTKANKPEGTIDIAEALWRMAEDRMGKAATLARQLLAKSPEVKKWAKENGLTVIP